MDQVAENRARLAKLGVTIGEGGDATLDEAKAQELGALVPSEQGYQAELEPEDQEYEYQADPPPPAPQEPQTEKPHKDRWDGRKEAAQKAQREASQLNNQVQQGLSAMHALMAKLEAKLDLPSAPIPPAPVTQAPEFSFTSERIKALQTASPELALALEDMAREIAQNTVAPLTRTTKELESLRSRMAEDDARTKLQKVIEQVQATHADALEVTGSPEFQSWLAKQPTRFQATTKNAIFEDTTNADPADIVLALNLYKTHGTTSSRPTPRVAPTLSPAMGTREKSSPVGALTQAEMQNFPAMKAAVAHDPVALRHLLERLTTTINQSQE